MKKLMVIAMLCAATSPALAEPLYVFNNYSGGYISHCHVQEFGNASMRYTISAADPKAKATFEHFHDQGANVYRERVTLGGGGYYVAMATDDELYCLRNYARWGYEMQREYDAHEALRARKPSSAKPPAP